MKPWSEVAASSGFKSLTPDQQDGARRQYFDDVVAPQVPASEREVVWGQFATDTGVGRRELPADVTPSSAGGGRGSVNPTVSRAEAGPSRAQRIAEMDEETDPSNPNYLPITRNAQQAIQTDARGGMDAKRTKAPGRVLDKDIPSASLQSIAQDAASGALQIIPTVAKGVGDITRMATGDRLGKGLSDYAESSMDAARNIVGSDRAAAQKKRFEQDMTDPALNPADVIVGNPGALADQVLPTVGSMALPVAVAAAAGKLATVSKAAQLARVIDEATVLARANKVREAAAIGATVVQNAADTYSTIRDKGGEQDAAYLGAAITAPATYVAGRLTGGGAEGQAAKLLAQGVRGSVAAIPKAAFNEGVQEIGEESGQYVGETVGTGGEFDVNTAGKRLAVAGTLGAVMGGGVEAAGAASTMRQDQIKRLRDAGETAVADLLQQKHDRTTAEASADGELQRMPGNPDFQSTYRGMRGAGVKPAEAAARSAVVTAYQGLAAATGIPESAAADAMKTAETLPLDQVPAFFAKFTHDLAAQGLVQPFEGMADMASGLEAARDDAIEAAMGAAYQPGPEIRQTMDDVMALEQTQAAQAAPTVHPTVSTADDIVRELAEQHGVPLETVLPSTPVPAPAAPAPVPADSVADSVPSVAGLNDQGEARAAELWMKPGDGTIAPQEQAELQALQQPADEPLQAPAPIETPAVTPPAAVAPMQEIAPPKPRTEKEARAQREEIKLNLAQVPVSIAQDAINSVAQTKEPDRGTQAPQVVEAKTQGQETPAAAGQITPPRTEKEAQNRRRAAQANRADSLPPEKSVQLKEAHKALGRDVTRPQVQRLRDQVAGEIESGQTNNGGVMASLKPAAIVQRQVRLERLDHDLALFGNEAAPQATPIATPNRDGTLNLEGDPAAIKVQLAEAGLSGVPMKGGMQVGRRQAAQAQSVFEPKEPIEQVATDSAAPTGPVHLGRNNQPLSEGGKPYKTRLAAGEAKKLQPMMRVVSVKGGFVLAEKTERQLAAEAQSARRLRNPQTSAPGEPIPAHAFVANEGGLHADTRADMNVGSNPKLGNRSLFAGKGKGLSMERATARLIEEGYLREGASHNEAAALIKRSLSQPQYNADGIERIAQADEEARYAAYELEMEESIAEVEALDDNEAAYLDDSDIPFGDTPSNVTTEAAMSALGFTEQEIQDEANANRSRVAQADSQSVRGPVEAAASDAQAGDGQRAPAQGQEQRGLSPQASTSAELTQARADLEDLEIQHKAARGQRRDDLGRQISRMQAAIAERETLTAPSQQDVLDQQARAEAAAKAEKAQQRAADELARRERVRKDIAKASEAAADTFTLGGDAEQNLSGQGGMFDDAPDAATTPAADQTDTPAFRKWFKGSKVVDAAGQPLAMYHGTSASEKGEAFTSFDTYASSYGLMGMGGYFTADPGVASSYTTKGKGTTPTVYKAFLSIQNPLDMDAKADASAWKKQFADAQAYHEGGTTNESWYRAAEESLSDQSIPMYEGAEIMQEGLRAMGHDGITHIGGGRVKSDGVKHRVYITFEPEQAKSATGNNGNFDKADPRMAFARSEQTETPAFKAWYGDWQNAAYGKPNTPGRAEGIARQSAGRTGDDGGRTAAVNTLQRSGGVGVYPGGRTTVGKVTLPGTAGPIDTSGKPVVFYHGTRDDFNAFRTDHPNRKDKGWLGRGVYLTSDESQADDYTWSKRGGVGRNIMPLYAAVKNPYIANIELKDRLKNASQDKIDAFTQDLVDQGHDGVILENEDGNVELVAFEPVQVKSAIANKGAFDASNPDITLARDRKTDPASGAKLAEVQKAVNELSAKWQNGPAVKVVRTPADLPVRAPSDARGLIHEGTAYIVASNNPTRNDVARTLAHEAIGHHGLWAILGEDGTKRFQRNLQLALKSGNKPLKEISAKVRRLYVDEKGNFNLSAQQESDEIAAFAVEDAVDPVTGQFNPGFGFVKDVYAKLAAWLRDTMGIKVPFTMAELHGMLVSSMRGLEAGKRLDGGGEAVAASRSAMKSVDANVRRGMEALAKALDEKTTVHRAMFRNGLGWVDFVWGSEGQIKASGKTKGAMGLSHILEARQRKDGMSEAQSASLMNDIVQAIASGSEFTRNDSAASTRIGVEHNKTIVWLVKNAGSNAWVVTGYEKNPDSADAGRATSAPTSATASLTRDGRVAGSAEIVAQNNPGGNPGSAFARGVPTPGPGLFQPTVWNAPDPTRTDRIIYELQDGKVDLKRVQEAIAKSGQQIAEKFDARLAETIYPGRVAYRSQTFLETEAKPLLEAMTRQKVGMNELADYLHARGAEERNKQIAKVNPAMPDGGAGTNTQGTLLTTQAARDYLANIRPDRKSVLNAMAKRVDAITAGTRKLLVTEGLEKQETIDAWEGAYKNYVPMFRDEAESAMPPHPQGAGFTVRGGASKRATGSTKEVTNILAHVLMQREAAITRAEKNRVALALYGQALSHPNPDFWTTIKPSMSAAQIGAELVAMGVDPMTAEMGMERAPTIRTVDPVTNKVVDRPNPRYKELPGAITLKVNGEDRVLMLNVKTERGQRLAESLKNLDGLTKFDLAGSIVGKSTRWLAAVNTQYNPAFGLVNVTRDVLGASINLGSTELRGNALKVLAQTPLAIVGIARELASGGQTGKWQTLYRQFQADGGQTGFKENFRDPHDRARAVEKELASLGRGKLSPGRAAHLMLDLLDGFNTTLENAVRLSAYSASLDKGMSGAKAARLGRELTVDFNRKGRMGREAGPLYAFFNASVQGSARTVESLKGPTGWKIMAGGLSLGMLQAVMLAAAGYEDDEIPEFVKTRALIIPMFDKEKTYITIPYPLGLHVIPNTGRVLAELTLNGGKDTGKRSAEAIGEIAAAFNPLGGGNIFTLDGLLKTVLPTVADPLIELGFNRNFAGGRIEKEGYGGESDNRPGVTRTKEATQRSTTGQVYMGISQAINTLTGGTDYEKGFISPTPERVRYLAQTVGGGVLREIEKTVNASTAAARGDKVKMSQIPVAGRFYGEVDDDQVQMSRYYDSSNKLKALESSFQAMFKAGDVEAARKFMDEHPEIAMASTAAAVQQKVSALNKLAVQTVKDPAMMLQIDEARAANMTALNEALKAQELAAGQMTLGQKLRAAVKPE